MTNQSIPLVPAEVDLRGLPWMRLDTGRLLDSDLFALSTGAEFKAAVALWCKSWTQMPAASLPMDDRILAHLSGAGTTWKKLKGMALRGWVECSDGRLYHPVVAEQALLAWEERVAYRADRDAAAERKRNERLERAQMFDALKASGHSPRWNAPTSELRDLLAQVTDLSRVTGGDQSQGHPHDVTDLSPAKRGTGRDGTGEGLLKASARSPGAGASAVEVIDGDGVPVDVPIATLSDGQAAMLVQACRHLRRMGVDGVNPERVELHRLVRSNTTVEQMATLAAELTLRAADKAGVRCLRSLDPPPHPDLPELFASAATAEQMHLRPEELAEIKGHAPNLAYLASTLEGRRRDAATNTPSRAKNGAQKHSVTDSFEEATYVGTAIEHLSPELRAAVERRIADEA